MARGAALPFASRRLHCGRVLEHCKRTRHTTSDGLHLSYNTQHAEHANFAEHNLEEGEDGAITVALAPNGPGSPAPSCPIW